MKTRFYSKAPSNGRFNKTLAGKLLTQPLKNAPVSRQIGRTMVRSNFKSIAFVSIPGFGRKIWLFKGKKKRKEKKKKKKRGKRRFEFELGRSKYVWYRVQNNVGSFIDEYRCHRENDVVVNSQMLRKFHPPVSYAAFTLTRTILKFMNKVGYIINVNKSNIAIYKLL